MILVNFFTPILFVAVYGPTIFALVTSSKIKHSIHRVREVSGGNIITFHPEPSYETFGQGINHPLTNIAGSTIEDSTVSFIESHLRINSSSILYRVGYSGETASHAYVSQIYDGIPFANAVANVAFNHNNKVVSFGSSFIIPKTIASSSPTISLEVAVATAEKALDGKFNDHIPTIEYLVREDGSVVLTHVMQIRNEVARTWYLAFVDAHSGDLVSVIDFVARASYLVLPIAEQAPSQGFQTITDPQDTIASPLGWHSTGNFNTTETNGNNIIAFKTIISSTTTQSSPNLNFIYPQNPSTDPTTNPNVNAARVNAFYIGNTIHDFSRRYGFTEAAFNFQFNNFGLGGLDSDPVHISIQDSTETNNAKFVTPPDGQAGQMTLFLWTFSSPLRDSSFENDAIIHEYTHGITNRMTGGGTGRCLQSLEAGGLGEGWSDGMADWTEHINSTVPDYVLGPYIFNNPNGIRSHPYSTSASVNPLRYSSLNGLVEVHDIGEVWANILHNVYASLVAFHGWSSVARTNPGGTEGNIVFLHLFIDALALQPCNPTFIFARDAWIQADANRYAGGNRCVLWRAFASRGLGVGAAGFIDSSAIPTDC